MEEDALVYSTLFTWLQGAGFYHDVHAQAVEIVPAGSGKEWLDVGSGPGLVARLARARGYVVTGIDADASMIQAAKRIAKRQGMAIDFQTGDVFKLVPESADVVSAASLLAVLDDQARGLKALWNAVRPGGTLLVVEPTKEMTGENAQKAIQNGLPRKRINGLRLWAAARQGNAVNPALYNTLDAETVQFTPLLDGMVGVWMIRKKKPVAA